MILSLLISLTTTISHSKTRLAVPPPSRYGGSEMPAKLYLSHSPSPSSSPSPSLDAVTVFGSPPELLISGSPITGAGTVGKGYWRSDQRPASQTARQRGGKKKRVQASKQEQQQATASKQVTSRTAFKTSHSHHPPTCQHNQTR